MTENYILKRGDCLPLMRELESASVDLVYLDPPFLTNKVHRLSTRDRATTFSFDDLWRSHKDYSDFILERIVESRRLLRDTGSIFLHCDRNASHILRALLDAPYYIQNMQKFHCRLLSSVKLHDQNSFKDSKLNTISRI